MPETARPRELGPSPHTHPAPLIWGACDNVRLLNPAQLLGRKRDAYPSPTRGQHKWGDAYPCPARVPITWYAYCILVLITFILHSQSTWTLGSQVPTKRMHKTCNSNCTIHGQIIILFLHNIISQPSCQPYWR